MKSFFRRLSLTLLPLCLLVMASIGFYSQSVPSTYVVSQGGDLSLPAPLSAQGVKAVSTGTGDYDTTLRLLGVFPVKEVSVREAGDMEVQIGGEVFGMKLYTSGVLVVRLMDVDTASGSRHPAADAGMQAGDVIESIDGQEVSTKGEVAALVERSAGQPMTLRVRRDGVSFTVRFAPVQSVGEERFKAGLWVRDSSAGIGTVSFYVPESGVFAGLGHPICDVDTGELLPISGGEIVPARVYTITKGVNGDAGELCGGFDGDTLGNIRSNNENGIYGILSRPTEGEMMVVAPRQEVVSGPAKIRCTLDESGPQWYDVEIRHVRYTGADRDLDIKVTDPALLARTGGIVQGMSGSPIVQSGKLVGAVTHVLVNDPTTGYGIFAETMLETAHQLTAPQADRDAA